MMKKDFSVEAQAYLESRFKVGSVEPGPTGNYSLAPTGEPYVEIVSGGEKTEGERCPCLCSSPEAAMRLWRDAVRNYARNKKGVLYWRIIPEPEQYYILAVNEKGFFTGPRSLRQASTYKVYRVYSRLLISDKPVIRKRAA